MRDSLDSDGAVRLALIGELDIAVSDALEERVRQVTESGRRVRLDLSQLEFIDSSGVRALVLSVKHAQASGRELEVDRRVSATVERMIGIMGIGPYLWPADQRPS